MEKEKEEFKPFVPAEKEMKEFSITAVIVGVLLAVVFGAANAYLGLRVGMTVSASIPAAVVSMGILRGLLRRNSILESNLVQTIGSAGFLRCLRYFCGQKKGRRRRRICLPSQHLLCVEAFLACFLWFRCAKH